MKHFGDTTKLDGHQLPLVDVITGGSPCQDLSVAGKRAGLDGERSGLFMEQIRVIKEMREESERRLREQTDYDRSMVKPRWMVWENVPGAFSSNKGEDFRVVLEETARVVCEDAVIPEPPKGKWTPSGCILGDGWSIAWRVHDAQFWGVPQRRKRIALVADFGGERAPEILFERKGVSGDSEQGAEKGQDPSTAAGGRVGPSITTYAIGNGQVHDALVPIKEVSKTLNCLEDPAKVLIEYQHSVCTLWDGSQVAPTLTSNNANGSQRMPDKENFNAVMQPSKCYGFDPVADRDVGKLFLEETSKTVCVHNQAGVCYGFDPGASRDVGELFIPETAKTLSNGSCPGHHNGVVCGFDSYNLSNTGDVGRCLSTTSGGLNEHMPVIYGIDRASFNQGENAKYDFSVEEEKAQPLVARGPGGGTDDKVGPLCARDYKGVGSQYVNEGKCIIQDI